MYVTDVVKRFGEEFRFGSFLSEDKELIFRELLKRLKPKIALEIGTCYGLSSAIISDYADKVYTIDITYFGQRQPIWDFLAIGNKVIPFVTPNAGKQMLCSLLDYDFAFIDGGHSLEDVKLDWENISPRCDRILFDDVSKDFPHVLEFVNSIPTDKIWKVERLGTSSLVYFERIK
jgi:predicted O-methyltransferase YrrM